MMFRATFALFDSISEQTAALRAEILAAEHTPREGARCFYLAPDGDDSLDGMNPENAWATLERMEQAAFLPGDEVLFERGGIWRGRFTARPGVTYSAFGDGDKPKIIGSPENGADPAMWREVAPDVWRYARVFTADVGGMVFNGGECHARKIILDYSGTTPVDRITEIPFEGCSVMSEDLTMWHDLGGDVVENAEGGWLYLCSKKGNPGERFREIEFLTRGNIIRVGGDNVTIDNLCILYGGCHGIGAGSVKGLTVTNCEVGWIGGSLQYYRGGHPVRFGNGIEIYGGCDGYTVDHCLVYQCYDAGITHQYSAVGTEPLVHRHVRYTNNLIEYCIYSVEYFMGKAENNAPRQMEDIVIRGNIMRFAGYGWGAQRPDKKPDAHIKGWDHQNHAADFIIEDNIFACSEHMLIHCGAERESDLPHLCGNTFLQYAGGEFGRFSANPTKLMPYIYSNVIGEEFAGNEFYLIYEN